MTKHSASSGCKFSRREISLLLGSGLIGAALPASGTAGKAALAARAGGDESLLSAPATKLARAIAEHEISSRELTRAYLERIGSINPGLNAVVHVAAEQAMEAARLADASLARGTRRGPLHGVPMTLKDSIDTAGVLSTYGTLGRNQSIPDKDATVAARLKAAGAVLLGKTNTPEFTLSYETDNLVFGRTKNPFDPKRTPGGSSGGAAAAVSSALCAFDIGSDTAGSIRVPAHFCGTAGLKPTQGRVPRTGHAVSFGGLHNELTQLGPMARSVDDLELLLRVTAGPDGRDPFAYPVLLRRSNDVALEELRIGWHTDNGLFTPTSAVRQTVMEAVRALGEAGPILAEIVPPPLTAAGKEFSRLFVWTEDGGAWIQRLLDAAGTRKAHPAIAAQIDPEYQISAAELTRLIELRDRFRSDMLAFMQDYDALLTPVAGFPAPLFGETEDEAHSAAYSYAQVYSLAGWPAAVVRCGTSPDGLPVGVQIAARPWREDVALAVARHLEVTFGGWKMPPLQDKGAG